MASEDVLGSEEVPGAVQVAATEDVSGPAQVPATPDLPDHTAHAAQASTAASLTPPQAPSRRAIQTRPTLRDALSPDQPTPSSMKYIVVAWPEVVATSVSHPEVHRPGPVQAPATAKVPDPAHTPPSGHVPSATHARSTAQGPCAQLQRYLSALSVCVFPTPEPLQDLPDAEYLGFEFLIEALASSVGYWGSLLAYGWFQLLGLGPGQVVHDFWFPGGWDSFKHCGQVACLNFLTGLLTHVSLRVSPAMLQHAPRFGRVLPGWVSSPRNGMLRATHVAAGTWWAAVWVTMCAVGISAKA